MLFRYYFNTIFFSNKFDDLAFTFLTSFFMMHLTFPGCRWRRTLISVEPCSWENSQ